MCICERRQRWIADQNADSLHHGSTSPPAPMARLNKRADSRHCRAAFGEWQEHKDSDGRRAPFNCRACIHHIPYTGKREFWMLDKSYTSSKLTAMTASANHNAASRLISAQAGASRTHTPPFSLCHPSRRPRLVNQRGSAQGTLERCRACRPADGAAVSPPRTRLNGRH